MQSPFRMTQPAQTIPVAQPPSAVALPPSAVAHPIPERGTLLSRLVWAVLFVVPTSVLVTAALLTPDPAGHGTHTQLGLPPCGFLVITGLPCPGCGLTTSFSHMMHIDPAGAAAANAFGVMLFLVTLTAIPVSLVGAVRGWPVLSTLDRLQADKIAILLAACSILVWLIRAATLLLG